VDLRAIHYAYIALVLVVPLVSGILAVCAKRPFRLSRVRGFMAGWGSSVSVSLMMVVVIFPVAEAIGAALIQDRGMEHVAFRVLLIAGVLMIVLCATKYWALRAFTRWLGGGPGATRRGTTAAVSVYALLSFATYFAICSHGLIHGVTRSERIEVESQHMPSVLYIAPGGSEVWRCSLDGTKRAKVVEIEGAAGHARLAAIVNDQGEKELWVSGGGGKGPRLVEYELEPDVAIHPGESRDLLRTQSDSYGHAAVWGRSGGGVERARTWMWPDAGLEIIRADGDQLNLALSVPGFSRYWDWVIRSATLVEGRYVVCQVGEERIVVVDALRRRGMQLVRGRGPIVVGPDR